MTKTLSLRIAVTTVITTAVITLAACSAGPHTDSDDTAAVSVDSSVACIEKMSELVGPNGEEGVMAADVKTDDAAVAAAKAALDGGKVALSTHFASDYTTQVVDGITAAVKADGGTLITTDAGGDPKKQLSDVESLIAQKPALLVVFPVDAATSSPGLQAARDADIPVVVVGSALDGADYTSLISAYDYGGGLEAGRQLITALDGKGDIAVMPYKYSLWHVDNRVKGFTDALNCAPGITVVEDSISCQAKADCATAFGNVLTANPTITGAFGAYDGIAQGMNAAARSAGWEGFITTSDLGLETAQIIKSGNQALQATAAQLTDCQGKAAGDILTLALAGKTVPKMVFCEDVAVDRSTVSDVYEQLFGAPLK